jgi:mono/diheme cytochrome c family protein
VSKSWRPRILVFSGVFGILLFFFAVAISNNEVAETPAALDAMVGDQKRGEYLIRAAGCVACHTDTKNDGEYLAGGPPIETQFGTFYAPNITPHSELGIGGWSLKDFYISMTAGVSPLGEHYFPAFPYTSYTRLRIQDIVDLKAYIDSVAPIEKSSVAHEISWPFGYRELLSVWKLVFFDLNAEDQSIKESSRQDRGDYLVNGPGHCGECHSQRNILGGVSDDNPLAGNSRGPEGYSVPAIAGRKSSIVVWDESDITFYLQTGVKPDGDVAGGAMSEVIFESTSYLTEEDAGAIALYLSKQKQ